MSDLQKASHRTMILPSSLQWLRSVHQLVKMDLERHNYSSRDMILIRLCLEEALVNAVEHGNRRDPHKNVRLEMQIDEDRAWFSIEDEGQGFDAELVANPTEPYNRMRPNGRGVFLLRSLMDFVQYSEQGNQVAFWKTPSLDE